MAAKNRGLGKGLDSLIPAVKPAKAQTADKPSAKEAQGVSGTKAGKETQTGVQTAGADKAAHAADTEGAVSVVRITRVEPNREQPRKTFDEEALNELADSIKQFGIIEPLIVQDRGDRYEIIAGERRWRAAKLAGLKEVPVVVKQYSDREIVEISLIENIQREDLNPIEEALAYKRLLTEFHLKQEEVAERVSKSRVAVTNALRLLKLSDKVQQMLVKGLITSGHARALLSLEDTAAQDMLADEILAQNLSVRDVEKRAKGYGKKRPAPVKKTIDTSLENVYLDVAERLKRTFNTKVAIVPDANAKGAGKIEIEFYSSDDLESILDKVRG